ncbi:ABC transporter permease [Streptomyces sioyaensis]|uniref:ABC transporter permease n=1 Tax=Streptomyces sioyaensis TaxID=67364 RepID=UPI003D75A9EE
MSGFVFVFLRVRAHRLLLTAALLSVLLTTTVLATLTAFTGAIGDAGLRQALRTRAAPAAALQVKAQLPAAQKQSADRAVARGARRAFDGLPFTVRTLVRSGPYALPRTLRSPPAPKDEPDLTQLAALDRSRLTLTAGHWPTAVRRGPLPVAMPAAAAARLGIAPGRRLTLDNRLSGSAPVTVEVTGVYRPTDRADPYWKLDDLGGRGVRTLGFTTYGPLYTDPAAFRGGAARDGGATPGGGAARGGGVAQDSVGWLATADFRPLTADRLTALSAAATAAPKALMADPAFAGQATATTGLPDALGQLQRALLVNRSTILIVALQLILLAGCALLLVARMLSTERAGETALLRARGGSRRRIAGLALAESLLLAAPAALGAPPLTGPLLHLLAGHGPSARIGLPLDTGLTGATWLTGGAVALGCALAVAAPALLRTGPAAPRIRRVRALPGATGPAAARTEWKAWGRTGADLGLLVIAGVAFWQLQRQTAGDGAGSGVLTGDTTGQLGIDPVLVAAPALALLAGTVLTLRLLPLAARLAERGAARGRGLAAALAGWQLSRRPQRAAGPVLLLVLATALGMELPPHTDRLRLTATLRSLRTLPPSQRPPMPDTDTKPQDTGPVPATLSALLTDGHGVPYALPLGSLAADGRPHPLTADLAAAAGAPAGRPAGPLRLTGLVAGLDQPPVAHRQQLTVTAAETTAGDGPPRPLAAPAALRWQPKITDNSTSVGQEFGPKAGRAEVPRGGLLSQTYDTGARLDPYGASMTTVRITAAHAARPPLAAVATGAFLRASGSTAGSVVEIPVNGQPLKARIVRAVRALPGPADAPATGGLLVDLGAVNEALSDRGAPPLTAGEWWLRPAPGATGRVVEALRARPDTDPDQVLVRDEIARQLHDDPLGLGPQTALGAAAVAAVALAAVGFGVGAAASVRERTREFAVLRALGAPRGQPARMIAAEQGVLIALALGVGAALGTALTRAVVPLVVLTEQAGRPRPPVLVELPAGPVVTLLAAVAAVPLLVVAALGLRPGDPVRALRGQGAR